MTPEFAAAVDSVFRQVLDLLDLIAAGEEFDPHQVQQEILDRLEQADAAAGATRDWDLARYALVAWVDEVLLDTDWSGRDWWSNNVLEVELFRTRECSTRFYELAEQARGLPGSQALEVFYDCVVLGFRGMYRSPETAQTAGGRPSESLEAWLRRTALALARRDTVEPPLAALPSGAPPRTARRWAVGAAFVFLLLLVIDVLLYHLRTSA